MSRRRRRAERDEAREQGDDGRSTRRERAWRATEEEGARRPSAHAEARPEHGLEVRHDREREEDDRDRYAEPEAGPVERPVEDEPRRDPDCEADEPG